jgi:hypothetical protein
MKQLIIGLAVMGMYFMGEVAFATGSPTNSNKNYNMNAIENYNMNSNMNTYKSTNKVSNTNKASSDQTQKQSQGQSQSAEYSGQNNQSVNLNTPRQAPAFGVYASGPCSGVSFALSTVLGGGGVGAIDGQCSIREAARIAGALGEKGLALELLEALDAVKNLPSRQTKKVAAVAVTETAATHQFGQ